MNMVGQFEEGPVSLPHDIFHVYILPHILSEHLHKLLVAPRAPDWHAFYTLPLVSSAFHDTCEALFQKIFGFENKENRSTIDEILTFTQSLWYQAKLPPQLSRQLPQYTHQDLMSGDGLIRVYICTALARSFLSLDVLWPIALLGRARSLSGYYDMWDGYEEEHWELSHDAENQPGSRMRDDVMHRVYLPLTCALVLCDSVLPERLAYVVADYLAEIVPVYSTAPVLLKYSQDLETFVDRVHRVDMETWETWALQTLDLIGAARNLLAQIQDMGKLVQSFSTSSEIPLEVLNATNIMKAVHGVESASWASYTNEIRARAFSLRREWGATQ